MVASNGGIVGCQGVPVGLGTPISTQLNAPVVGMVATHDGNGYWEVAADGGIFAYGDARFEGSMGGTHLNRPVVGMAVAPG